MMTTNRPPPLSILEQELRRGCPRFTAKELVALVVRAKAGDRRAQDQVIRGCLPFVKLQAQRYNGGNDFAKTLHRGTIGLARALDRFDPTRGFTFLTYARHWIRQEILRASFREDYFWRLDSAGPERIIATGLKREERRLLAERGVIDDVELLKRLTPGRPLFKGEVKMAPHHLRRVRGKMQALRSMSEPAHGGHGEGESWEECLQDTIADPAATPADDALDADQTQARLRRQVDRAIAGLPDPRLQDIARNRLMRDEPDTLDEIGARHGVSRERIRQLEKACKAKLHQLLTEARA